jgi:hypothetical protein
MSAAPVRQDASLGSSDPTSWAESGLLNAVSSSDNARRQVDGLVAGMTLLDELDPFSGTSIKELGEWALDRPKFDEVFPQQQPPHRARLQGFLESLQWTPDQQHLQCPSAACHEGGRQVLKFDSRSIGHHFSEFHRSVEAFCIADHSRESAYHKDAQMKNLARKDVLSGKAVLALALARWVLLFRVETGEPTGSAGDILGKKCGAQSAIAQLGTLRRLRVRMILLHRQFLNSLELWEDDKEVSDLLCFHLRHEFRCYKQLLHNGLLVFKQVLRGQRPHTLFDVFAFVSLVRAMDETMKAAGHDDGCFVTGEEMERWEDNIYHFPFAPTGSPRKIFRLLSRSLWPDWCAAASATDDDLHEETRSNCTEDPFLLILERILAQTAEDEAFDFSFWLQDSKRAETLLPNSPPSGSNCPSSRPHDPGKENNHTVSPPCTLGSRNLESEDPREWSLVIIALAFVACKYALSIS